MRLAQSEFAGDAHAIAQYNHEVRSKYIMPAELHRIIMTRIRNEGASDFEIGQSIGSAFPQAQIVPRTAEWRRFCIEPSLRFGGRQSHDEPPCKEIAVAEADLEKFRLRTVFVLSDAQKVQLIDALLLEL